MGIEALKKEAEKRNSEALAAIRRPVDSDARGLAEAVGPILGIDPEALANAAKARADASRARVIRANLRFVAALERITDAQAEKVDARERNGYRIDHTLTDRNSRNTAVVMAKDHVWNPGNGRAGRKLAIIYPDGSSAETFERSISVRREF